MTGKLNYSGHPKYQPQKPGLDNQGRRLFPYLPDPNIVKAVNLAIALERPLLIQGEPGCGKTLIARAIAYEFGQKYLQGKDEWPYFRWNVTSRTEAQQGCYTFDALGKLRDAQMVGIESLTPQQREALNLRLADPEGYISWGPLGQAFREQNHRPVLLIDEIDKADVDFPNDLLSELEEPRFRVVETQKPVIAKKRPIVIITSNSERELPEAFLRRCLFYWLEFPEEMRLREIISLHFPEYELAKLFDQAISQFFKVRNKLANRRSGNKQASTSELLDWLRIMTNLPAEEALTAVENVFNDPAQLGILVKSKADLEAIKRDIGEVNNK